MLGAAGSLPAADGPAWLIATASETIRAGSPLNVEIVGPAPPATWPDTFTLRLTGDDLSRDVALVAVEPGAPEAMRRRYQALLPADLSGLLRAELADRASNRLALLVSATDSPDARPAVANQAEAATVTAAAADPALPATEPVLSAHEPMFFVVGGNDGVTARFQLSFKYRLFDTDSTPVIWLPPLASLYFAYTQTSTWDLGANSAPFRDTSYRPALFWQGAPGGGLGVPDLLRAGVEHESNGRDGTNSRSINTAFVQPVWRLGLAGGGALVFAPKAYAYLDKSDNREIDDFRGHMDWNFRYGYDDGWLLAAQLRHGNAGHGSALLDLSYPLRQPLFAHTGGFVHLQLFNGYGETLLDYNRDRGTQFRMGFSIVR
jgi:outer membrane phospholipase A